MISYDEALGGILAQSRRLESWRCPAAQALGKVLAGSVASPEDLPPFDNSAMDGFALCAGSGQLVANSEFVVVGTQAAGDDGVRAAGGAWEIMTGARMPEGMDTVVPVEQVRVLTQGAAGRPLRIRLDSAVGAGRNVRRRGEDVPAGVEIMASGELLRSQHVALLAALGVSDVTVVRRPRVAIICTGRELVDDPGQPLQSGQIRNSNAPFLAARVAAAGAEVVYRQTVGDDQAEFLRALERALQAGADVLLSTGAVSMGRYDFVPEALRGIGAKIHFHKVRIRPGKPLLFASLPGGALYFGLPGNPASSAVGLRFFVEPALRTMLGLPLERPLRVPLRTRWEGCAAALRCFLKGRLDAAGDGQLHVTILAGQESFRIRPLLDANAWVVMPEDALAGEVGSLVDVYLPGHLHGLDIGSIG